MDFACAGITHHLHDLDAGGAPHDRIVDQHDLLALDQRGIGIVLQLDPEVADFGAGLEEGAADVMRANDPELERDIGRLGKADRGGDAAVGNGDDHVDLDRAFAGEFGADVLAALVDRNAIGDAIGATEVDMLEDARPGLGRSEGAKAAQALVVDQDHLARSDLALEPRPDHVERDGLGSEDHRIADPAHDQRPDAERVAAGDQPDLGQDEQRIGPLDLLERVDQLVEHRRMMRGCHQVDDDLGVRGGLEDRAAPVERAPKLHRVRQIAVMRDRKAALGEFGEQRLDVAQCAGAGGRVADMADGGAAGERADDPVLVECPRDMAAGAMRVEAGAVAAGDPAGFLPAMLQRVQAERDEARRAIGIPHPEYAAFLAQLVVVEGVGADHGNRQAFEEPCL